MANFEAFEQCLQETLAHLYDPTYRPPETVWEGLGITSRQGADALRQALVQAIEAMKPGPTVPVTARVRRLHGLLSLRYAQDLTQEETAERLGISPRHLRREQPDAVHALAIRLWQQATPAGEDAPSRKSTPEGQDANGEDNVAFTPDGVASPEWRSQVRQELASLQESAPGTVADVAETIDGIMQLAGTLVQQHGVRLNVEPAQPHLIAAIHPTALRQALIKAIGELAQHMTGGQITLDAQRSDRRTEITITGHPVRSKQAPGGNLIREILASQGGSFETHVDGDRISFLLGLPSVEQDILVVDDNPDMIYLYRRYVVGTRYHIQHTTQGQQVFEMIEASRPDVIVLDVMLPDIDGWELLTHLREHPISRTIPVIVCSVVEEEKLALALGAALYLSKPIQRQAFIRAIGRALGQSSARALTSPANNRATG